MKVFYILICLMMFAACSTPKYGELSDANGIFTSLQNNEFITIAIRYPDNGFHDKISVFRKGTIVEIKGGKPLSNIELVALDSFIKSVNGRAPTSSFCTLKGSLTLTKTLSDGLVRRYRGLFDGCSLDEQAILLDVLGDPDDWVR